MFFLVFVALLRPGRFDQVLHVPLPDWETRVAIFEVYSKKIPLGDDVNLDKLASMTESYSGTRYYEYRCVNVLVKITLDKNKYPQAQISKICAARVPFKLVGNS